MCAIAGIFFLRGSSLLKNNGEVKDIEQIEKIVSTLLLKGEQRGTDATGIAIMTASKLSILKHNITATDFIEQPDYQQMLLHNLQGRGRVYSIILHNRYKTKGDKMFYENNHPIISSSKAATIVGVHNGCISNDDSLFEKHRNRFEYIGLKRRGQVDSEIIFSLINMFKDNGLCVIDAIKEAKTVIEGSMACACLSKESPHLAWLFRDTSQTYLSIIEELGIIVFASMESYVRSTFEKYYPDIKVKEIMKYGFNKVACFDLYANATLIDELPPHKSKFDYLKEGD